MESSEYQRMDTLETTHPWFVAKREFLDTVLKRYGTKGKVLDVGCGSGAVMANLQKEGYEVCGVDFSEEALEFCRKKGLNVKQGVGGKLPFEDNEFDVVLALDVLEHIEDAPSAVAEIKRVLRSGGVLVCTVPAHQFLWSKHDEFLHHKRRYNKKILREHLQGGGLSVQYISYIHSAIFAPLGVVRLLKKLFKIGETGSEVQPVGKVVAAVLRAMYAVEIPVFRIFGRLPVGLSLIAVSKKI